LMSMLVAPVVALSLSILAVLLAAIGIFTERWLFFAEAEHVVTLYYGATAA
ncbi:MAG: dimethyl sulfoxide reductase anchor subunit, partial [Sphingomonadales bacterium]|nr:dimethyl sulfoxide reductase anchor subunit [Sphingomonadales bacterium]